MEEKYKIGFVDGLCGAGKTFSIATYLKENNITRCLIAVPSIKLANQINETLQSASIKNILNIHSETTESTVSDIEKSINNINDECISDEQYSSVIVCTQKAFSMLKCFPEKSKWTLIIDEIPTVDSYIELTLPYNNKLLADYVDIDESFVLPDVYRLKIKNQIVAKEKITGNHDEAYALVKPIISDLMDGCVVVTDKSNWNKIVIRNEITSDRECKTAHGNTLNKIYILSMQQPTKYIGFKRTIIMGANFQNSILHKYWSEHCKIEFKEFNLITKLLRYNKYQNGHRLHIKYLQESNYTDYQANQEKDGETLEIRHAKKVVDLLKGQKFVFVANKNSVVGGILKSNLSENMPVICHGRNDWDTFHNVYFSAALNKSLMNIKLLNAIGIDHAFIQRSQMHEIAHQGIMRTSMRRPDATEIVTAYVVDKATAESIARLFDGCSFGAVDGVLRKVVKSQAEHNKKSKLKKIIDQGVLKKDYENHFDKNKENCVITLLSCLTTAKTSLPYFVTEMEVVNFLKKIYTNNLIENKSDNHLFNCSRFEYQVVRDEDNVLFASCFILDVDNGDISPVEFKRIFAKRFSYLLFNTFSTSIDKPNNYRALFFLSNVVTADGYRSIYEYVRNIITDAGYITCRKEEQETILVGNPSAKFSGVDITKNHSASFFFVPCKNKNNIDYAFFERCNFSKASELKRRSINVNHVLKYSKDKTDIAPITFSESLNSSCKKQILSKAEIISKITSGNYKHLSNNDDFLKVANGLVGAKFTIDQFRWLSTFILKPDTKKDVDRYWYDATKYSTCDSNYIAVLLH
ncbi:MAG: DEAD/DEAH box helicase family protein [Methylococcales bacterium]|nr:DEAD/DEAH box helicase family protein [Methylococcales bacterium]